ncbi:MAG: exo-alpha-sialidase [Herpetosiphonaceae bacterium]|nr:exo-alpha-sialidase [Herpetosiphonaceae bacterium]
MNFRRFRPLIALAAVGVLLLQSNTAPALATPVNYSTLTKLQHRLLSGLADLELNPKTATTPIAPKNYYPHGTDDACAAKIGSTIKVNQNCLNLTDAGLEGRAQAQNETSIAVDPNNSSHLVASYNDYRRGDGNCYTAYSLDKGQTWNDSTVPMGFTSGAPFGGVSREYWTSGGDTSVAWDTKGNAYLSCQVFQRGLASTNNPDASSAFLLFRSTQNKGASWNFPGRYVVARNDVAGAGNTLLDKQLMTVDNHVGSPFQDRVYVTYTDFAVDGTAYIYESYSADYGETFSTPVVVSNDSPLCTNTYGLPTPFGKCNENQFSQPFTGSDGALYVAWANFSNPVSDGGGGDSPTSKANDNHNQMLLAKSTDGGQSFGAPVLISNYHDLPDCATYQNGQDAGRACVPEKGSTTNSFFRATNYPSGAVNPTNPQQVVVTFGSYINSHSNETNGCFAAGLSPDTGGNLYTGVKTDGACNNDILLSVSNDGGATFNGSTTNVRKLTSVTQNAGKTDQWWQWAAFTSSGKLAVSYYDRQYGTDETTGFSDVSLASSSNLSIFNSVRVTSSPMPPPTQFSGQFFGDYTGLAATTDKAYPLWMDTHKPELFLCAVPTATTPPAACTASAANASVANDQDIYTSGVALP